MTPKRVLLIERAGPLRQAVQRVIRSEGHEVMEGDTAESGGSRGRFKPDMILYGETIAPADHTDVRLHRLTRPVNMEELRRVLREG